MSPIPIRTLLAICALALPIPAVAAGCGDDESTEEDPQTVLDETFDNDETVSSGNFSIRASVSAEGEEGGSFEGSLSGPFQGDPDDPTALPQLDLTASASGEGGGESIEFEGGLVVTEDNAYVEYEGETYEVGTEDFGELRDQLQAQAGTAQEGSALSFQEACEQSIEQAGGDPSACEIDPAGWLTNLTNEGTEEVGGAETIHISGDADVEQILTDLGGFAAAIPGAEQQGVDPTQLGQLREAVTEASLDLYSGVDDRILRGLDAHLVLDPAAIAGPVPVPVENVDVSFSLEIADVNEEQTIEAPSGDVKPIEELTGEALGLGEIPLGGASGGLPGAGGGGGGGGASQRYLDCIAQAEDAEAISACAAEL